MPPISLNENGKEMLTASGFLRIFETHGDEILEEIRKCNPATNYDVQEMAIKTVISLSDNPYINPVKDYAYKKGKSVENILYFGGIHARDMYFEKFNA
ncbi:MAG: hypothetical protein KAJ54_02885 [Candidatus Aenigmarchaeota archaeon]|nr:hypothetical protein [Candidatus Aenigmarchaeota archaeon]